MSYTNGLDKPSDYFNTKLYTGNGSTQSITGVGFQPDWVWIKNRSGAYYHQSYDAVRGSTKKLLIDPSAESTDATGLTSFDSDGFSLGTNIGVNENTSTHVAWNWLANGSGSSNTDGSITSTVSANTTSGFSIVTYTGDAGASSSFGHGLGVKPDMIIYKQLSGGENWLVTTDVIDGSNDYGYLNTTDAFANAGASVPTVNVVNLTASGLYNASGQTYVAYCFAEKKGFSKFGSYTGNSSSDGPFVYTGFKPAFVLVKNASTVIDWVMYDNKRNTYNVVTKELKPNLSNAESTNDNIDILSNGFKLRSNYTYNNYTGNTYIYMAFAQHPIVSSSGTPCTAR